MIGDGEIFWTKGGGREIKIDKAPYRISAIKSSMEYQARGLKPTDLHQPIKSAGRI